MAGWIKFHRKILENPIFLKPELYQLFSYCLLRANHEETKIVWNNKEEIIGKGCFITGRKVIAKELKQTESATYKRLKTLTSLGMISVKSNNKYSVVKVLNYCIYQGEEFEAEQQSNNKVTTKEQLGNTDKNDKNVKNDKKDIYTGKKFTPPTLEEVKQYCLERQNNVSPEKWIDHYTSNGWMVGKNKMKDWKAAVRTWEQRDKGQLTTPKTLIPTKTPGKFDDMYL